MIKIYIIVNKINNYIYIGQTKNVLSKRWLGHISDSKRHNTKLCNAIRKYGADNFIIEELNSGEWNNIEADNWEKFYIKLFDSKNRKIGYNIKDGGNSVKMTEETKKKISEKNKGRKCSEKELKVRRLKHTDRYNNDDLERIRKSNSKAKSGGKNNKALEILNIETGIFYECIKYAAEAFNINRNTLAWQLRNNKSNNFIYI